MNFTYSCETVRTKNNSITVFVQSAGFDLENSNITIEYHDGTPCCIITGLCTGLMSQKTPLKSPLPIEVVDKYR